MGRISTAEQPLKKPIDASKSLDEQMLELEMEKGKEEKARLGEGNLEKMFKFEAGKFAPNIEGKKKVVDECHSALGTIDTIKSRQRVKSGKERKKYEARVGALVDRTLKPADGKGSECTTPKNDIVKQQEVVDDDSTLEWKRRMTITNQKLRDLNVERNVALMNLKLSNKREASRRKREDQGILR
jgi:hypothetical protein